MTEQVLVPCRATGSRAGATSPACEPPAWRSWRAARRPLRSGRYLERPVAEESPQWKQLIPYVVVRDGDLTFLMERTSAGGDPRLHRKASIGVGGHLNPVDAGEDPLQGGLRREWAEELVADWEPQFQLLGLLNDDTNPVGSVHLGVVFQVDSAGQAGPRAGDRQAQRTNGRCVRGGSGLGAAGDVVPAGGDRAARGAQRGARRGDAYTRWMVRLRRALALGAMLLGTLSLVTAGLRGGRSRRAPRAAGGNRPGQRRVHRARTGHRGRRRRRGRPDRDRLAGRRADQHGPDHQGDPGQPGPAITYVAPEGAQAGSAATFITLAGDVAAMAPSTTIGAASVVGSGGADLPDTLADKINNSNAAKIKDLAAAHDRNTEWAEAAVRDAASVSAAEAVAMDPPVVDLVATDVDDLFAQIDSGQRADGQPYEFDGEPLPPALRPAGPGREHEPGPVVPALLSDPNIAFILFTIGFYGIVSELFHPNFFSGPVGVIALVLAFIGSNSLPLNLGGLLLILLGIGLFILELHVTSYGLLTIGGVVAIVLGAFALWTGVDPQQDAINVSISPWLLAVVVACRWPTSSGSCAR